MLEHTLISVTMSGKSNYLIRYNMQFIVLIIIVILISTPFLPVRAISLPMFVENEPVVLMSWKDYKLSVDTPSIPDVCKKSYVCDNVINYPTELVAIILNELAMKNITKFTNDQLHENEYSNGLSEVEELCETQEEKILYPRAAKDRYSKWQFILNIPGYRFQSFRVHECLDVPEAICSQAAYITDSDFSFECEQQFAKREMVYLDLEMKVVKTGYFSIPSCCSCYLGPS